MNGNDVWAPYVERFNALAAALNAYSGFVLQPVAVSSAEVARALADSLDRAGRSTTVVEPQTAADWRELVATMSGFVDPGGELTEPGRSRALMVIGADVPSREVRRALRLVNQHRDQLVALLGCPLLWCGVEPFLAATADEAPDFWSVRAIVRYLLPDPGVGEGSTQVVRRNGLGWAGSEGLDVLWNRYHAARRQGDDRQAFETAVHLANALGAQSCFQEALDFLDEMDRMPLSVRTTAAVAALAVTKARLLMVTSQTAAADAVLASVLPVVRQAGDRLGEANCLLEQGEVARMLDRYKEAGQRYADALTIHRAIGDRTGEANCLTAQGEIAKSLARYAEAEERFAGALLIYRSIGNRLGEADCLKAQGDVAGMLDRFAQARERYEQALSIYRSIGSLLGEVNCLTDQSSVELSAGEQQRALPLLEEAIRLAEKLDSFTLARCRTYLGETLAAVGRTEDARAALELAELTFSKLGISSALETVLTIRKRYAITP